LDRFAANVERLRQEPKGRPNQRAAFVLPDKRDAWLTWRAEELSSFYDALQLRVASARPEARLYLPLSGLLEGPAAEQKIRDSLLGSGSASLSDLWFAAGIDPASWKALRETVFLLPNHWESDRSALSKLYYAAETSEPFRQFGAEFWLAGAASHPQAVHVTLNDFSQRGPFRGSASDSFEAIALRPHGFAHPLVEGLVITDPFAISVNSSTSPSHREQPSGDWMEILRRLPPVMMESVAVRAKAKNHLQPHLVLRPESLSLSSDDHDRFPDSARRSNRIPGPQEAPAAAAYWPGGYVVVHVGPAGDGGWGD
jgi:hypothetical protein